MNARVLLEWAIQDAEKQASCLATPGTRWPDVDDTIAALTSRKDDACRPPKISKNPDRALQELREHYNDDVAKISLLLHHHFPREFLFYRPSKMEPEIFDGLTFLAAVCPEFQGLERVRRTGIQRYLSLNEALRKFADRRWKRVQDPQTRVTSFLCWVLAPLFLQERTGERRWIFATTEEHFASLDSERDNVWSGNREMAEGDLVFIYRTYPVKAITDLYETTGPPTCNPTFRWDIEVPIRRLARLHPIPFFEMRSDPVLSRWGVIKKQFQGTTCDPIPDVYYNRLLEFVPEPVIRKLNLKPSTISPSGSAGNFGTEADFSKKVVKELLHQCGLRADSEFPCPVHLGHQLHSLRVDYLVRDEHGPLTVVECKLRIRNSDQGQSSPDLEQCIAQAQSYALNLRTHSFVVASPEGFWVYSMDRYEPKLRLFIQGHQWKERAGEMKRLLQELRGPV